MAGITALNKNGRDAFGGGGSWAPDSSTKDGTKGTYQGGSGAPGSAESKAMGGDGGYNKNERQLTGDDYRTAKKEFEYNVDKRKLKRPEDDLIGPQGDYPGSLYYTGVPKSNIPFFGKYLNMAAPLRNKGLRKNIDYFLALKNRNPNLDYEDTLEGYKQYMSDRLSGSITASGNTIYNEGGNNNTSIPLYAENTIGSNIPEEDLTEEFTYRMGDDIYGAADVTQGYYAANGGRVPRAFGGIMDTATGRRAYGLGRIFKSITKPFKGIAKVAGKVLKSDLGKAALGIGAFMYGPKLFGATDLGGFGGWGQAIPKSGFMSKLFRENIAKKGMPFKAGGLDPWKIGGMALTALPFLGIGTEAKQDTLADSGTRGGSLIDPLTGQEATPAEMRANINSAVEEAQGDPIKLAAIDQKYNNMLNLVDNRPYKNYALYADGGRIGFSFGGQPLPHDPTKPVNPFAPKPTGPVLPNKAGGYGKQRVMAEEGGLMNLGGMEKDYRNEGGFVPIGKEEKADDVPARLSVNEFVFTADAVRNAGGGDIDKGAEVMENMMKNLEKGGRISEESQGNTGAQEMFSVSERIGEVI